MHEDLAITHNLYTHDEAAQGRAFSPVIDRPATPSAKRFYIESYGCQMNFSDSEIVASILADMGYTPTRNVEESDLILINTCSIREKAEDTVRKRLRAPTHECALHTCSTERAPSHGQAAVRNAAHRHSEHAGATVGRVGWLSERH
jgi:hypothetical protein